MEGESKAQQITLDWCDQKDIEVIQKTLNLGLDEGPRTEPEIIEMPVLNEAFFKTGYLKRSRKKDIIRIRERILNNKETTYQNFISTFTPTEKLVFTLESYIREKNERAEDLVIRLWYPFRKHNLGKEQMKYLIVQTRKALKKKRRIIIPSQLITLAALNHIDNYLAKPNTSKCFFKTRILKDLPVGRRAAATRELRRLGYIEHRGNRWKRTKKPFNPSDFSEVKKAE